MLLTMTVTTLLNRPFKPIVGSADYDNRALTTLSSVQDPCAGRLLRKSLAYPMTAITNKECHNNSEDRKKEHPNEEFQDVIGRSFTRF